MRETTDRPKARGEGVVVREVAGEVLIYDLQTHKAVCLNETAGRVWRLCDGRRTVMEIRRALESSTGEAVPEELVWLALEQLGKDRLLDARVERPAGLAVISRRELMRRVGKAAVISLPFVVSIVAPTAAQAGSACNTGAQCTSGLDCASGCTQGCVDGHCF